MSGINRAQRLCLENLQVIQCEVVGFVSLFLVSLLLKGWFNVAFSV